MSADAQRSMRRYGPPEERFRRRLKRVLGGCLEYQGCRAPNGYGRFAFSPDCTVGAHRFAWELAHGPVPPGLYVCHHCDNPVCCEVPHLFVGTARDNALDMVAKGRHANQWTHRQEPS